MIQWSWRIEGRRSILCGSWADERRWLLALACLTKTSVASVALFGRLPEIDLTLCSGMHVVSFMTVQGDPEWTLFDRRGGGSRSLYVRRGRLCVEVDRDQATHGVVPH